MIFDIAASFAPDIAVVLYCTGLKLDFVIRSAERVRYGKPNRAYAMP